MTARVARAFGARDDALAARIGIHALALAFSMGAVVTVVGVALAGPIVSVLAGGGPAADLSESYLRIRVLSSIPVQLVTVGHGWLRGVQDTRTPMYIVGAGATANIGLDYWLIYGAGWGVQGAAWATVIGQSAAAAAFLTVLIRRMKPVELRLDVSIMRKLLSVGADLIVRAGALVGALTAATAVAARMGIVALGAWQVTMQAFNFLALSLDAVAIAGQALVGKYLGAGVRHRATEIARRLMGWGVLFGIALLVGLFLLRRPVAGLFSDDAAIVTAAAGLLGWLALVQPLAAAAFTLDGILIGASDTRFLAVSMVLASALYVALGILSLGMGWGTAGLAGSMTAWLVARTAALGRRLQTGRWTYQT